jgi:hypothetical protein
MRHTIYTTVFLNGYGYIFFTIVKTNTTFKSEWEHTDKKSSWCVWERQREKTEKFLWKSCNNSQTEMEINLWC